MRQLVAVIHHSRPIRVLSPRGHSKAKLRVLQKRQYLCSNQNSTKWQENRRLLLARLCPNDPRLGGDRSEVGTSKVKSKGYLAASVPLCKPQQTQQSKRTNDENAHGISNHCAAYRKSNPLQQSTSANRPQCVQTRQDEGVTRNTCRHLLAPEAQRVACAKNQLGAGQESGIRSWGKEKIDTIPLPN